MKKIALLLSVLFIFTCTLVSCKDDVDTSSPDTTIKELWDVPYQYDLSKYVDISRDDYIGVSYTEASYSVDDNDIYSEIQKLLDKHVTYVDVAPDTPAENGHYVNIDYKGFIDGKELENGSEEGAEFELGNASFIPGFQEGIVGHRVGETFVVDAKFPDNYGVEELNGKTAQFEMTLNKLQDVTYPPLTDEFIAEKTECKTVEEYYNLIKEDLIEKNESSAVVQQKNEAFSKIYSEVEILEIPKKEYEAYYNDFVGQYYALAEQYNQDFATFITETAGSTVDEFKKYAEQYATSSVETELIFFWIAKEEKILDNLTKAHYDDYLENIAAEYLTTPEEFVKMYGEESIWKSLVWDSVMDFVLANGTKVPAESTEPEIKIELNDESTTDTETTETPDAEQVTE